ncbi:hypothetical protein JY651_14760 [Pyxidicoccus parkwayensis]|uniref:Lipoprotein n=1 Tax=Pyxidicoccus parkwayensis TaxID=2813578 RepID=A0ABX7P6M1_9BACT|nr:hypothetical protein [Pyxidicoccus parkwaysis]QSQ26106.1 hypothetical protein JY651_14760 [Pyxidicoccus parkwaysis]
MAVVTSGLRGLALVLVGAALGCGDSLVDDAYSGTPLFTVPGNVTGTSEHVGSEHPDVSVAVFWSLRGMPYGEQDVFVEQQGTAIRAEYYRNFELRIFDEPGPEHLITRPSGAKVGVAWLGAYQDTNGNRRRDDTEPLIGGSPGRVLIRAPQRLSAQDSPTGAALPEGWYFVSTPLECRPPPPDEPPAPAQDCGVPLGISCRVDAECGANGVCIHELIGPWPGGACAIVEPPPSNCRQKGSVLLRVPEEESKAYWLKSCNVTADCEREPPYQCDQQLRACRPTASIAVEMNDKGPPPSYCKPDGPSPTPP